MNGQGRNTENNEIHFSSIFIYLLYIYFFIIDCVIVIGISRTSMTDLELHHTLQIARVLHLSKLAPITFCHSPESCQSHTLP